MRTVKRNQEPGGATIALALVSAAALTAIGLAFGPGEKASARVPGRKAEGKGVQAARAADGRGRTADTPAAMPAAGWKDIALRTFREFSEDRLMLVAAGCTFYVLLALFPAITALVSIYGLFSDPASISQQVDALGQILPGGAIAVIGEQMQRVASQADGKLGIGLVFGLGVALWSANAGMKTLFDAMNIVYEEEEKRSFVWLNAITLFFTLCAIVFLVLALSAVVLLPIVLDFLHLGGIEPWLLLLRWPALLLLVAVGLSVVYRYGPSRAKARWNWLSPGAVLAAILWVVFSLAFSWYAQNFGSYDETYGSLGAAIGFMTWIWISTIVVLLGAELNAELEHQTARDTTRHAPRPLGSRGAQMADTLGETSG